jgi:hypothetical protein
MPCKINFWNKDEGDLRIYASLTVLEPSFEKCTFKTSIKGNYAKFLVSEKNESRSPFFKSDYIFFTLETSSGAIVDITTDFGTNAKKNMP